MLFRTAEAFIEYLAYNPDTKIGILSLDHDLGEDIMDGYDLVKQLYHQFPDISIKEVRLHTDNYVGFENMYRYLVSAITHDALPNVKYVSPYVYDAKDGEITRGLKYMS